MRVVISQPMYFPWLGQINQALMADKFIFYSDVQFARHFINRVQLLIKNKQEFITVPTLGSKRRNINKLIIDNTQDWQNYHISKMKSSFDKAQFANLAVDVAYEVFSGSHNDLASLAKASVMKLCELIIPENCPQFLDSEDFPRKSKGTQALVDICLEIGASHYLTGHGAKNYMDISLFEKNNIQVEFIDYKITTYPQYKNIPVTNYVSSLDAIARIELNQVCKMLQSDLIPAKEFIKKFG